MRSGISTLILIIALFILSIAVNSYGHGGGHEKATPEIIAPPQVEEPTVVENIATKNTEASFENSTYDEGPDESSEMGLGEYDLGEEEPAELHDSSHMMENMVTQDSHEGMDMSGDDHSGHEMKKVELATHEWVSKSQKGYSAAMGITILAGLMFGLLTLKRPFE
ncbi:MAG: hypothetical protein ACQ9MH_12220 [Nitrospinales bacterium]